MIDAVTTLINSGGICARTIPGAPTERTPNRKAANGIPNGELEAKSATDIPLKPISKLPL